MEKNAYLCSMVLHFSYSGEDELRDLKKALNTIENRCQTPLDTELFDEEAIDLFCSFASHLVENAQQCLNKFTELFKPDSSYNDLTFDDYAAISQFVNNYRYGERIDPIEGGTWNYQCEKEYIESIDTLSQNLCYTLFDCFERPLKDSYHLWADRVYWSNGTYSNTLRKANKLKCSSDPEKGMRELKNEIFTALENNVFGREYTKIINEDPTERDIDMDDDLFEILHQHIIHSQDDPSELWSPSTQPEAFSFDQELQEYCELRASWLLLNDETSTFFDNPEETEEETQQVDNTTSPKKEPDNYTSEERLKIINCYKGLANFMTIDTHWITDIFKPNDDNLWAAIKADGQTALMHPNRIDGTNIAPLLNLLGVLCHSGKLSDKPSSYYNKLSEQLTHLDKNRIASLVKNGNRKEPRGLARTIKKRLDKLTEQ